MSPRWTAAQAAASELVFPGWLLTLVDSCEAVFASLLPGLGCTGLYLAVTLTWGGGSPTRPRAGSQSLNPDGQTSWGYQWRAHKPWPSPPQPCEWPLAQGGWWVLTAGREECGQCHLLPPSLPAKAAGNSKGRSSAKPGRCRQCGEQGWRMEVVTPPGPKCHVPD